MLIKLQSLILHKHFFVSNKSTLCFKLYKLFLKNIWSKKIEKPFEETSYCLCFTDF